MSIKLRQHSQAHVGDYSVDELQPQAAQLVKQTQKKTMRKWEVQLKVTHFQSSDGKAAV